VGAKVEPERARFEKVNCGMGSGKLGVKISKNRRTGRISHQYNW